MNGPGTVDTSGKRNQYYRTIKNCIVCGAEFRAARSTRKYCSNTCKRRQQNYPGDAWKRGMDRVCTVCGKTFSAVQPLQRQMYCSNACKQRAYRERKARAELRDALK